MKVNEIMTSNPQRISPKASIVEAANHMRMLDIGMLPVCEGERLVGILTDRDITIRAVAQGLDPKATRVFQMMTEEVVSCGEEQSIEEAARLMRDRKIRRLPVVNESKQLIGILSLGNLSLRATTGVLPGEVLESVSTYEEIIYCEK